jgi:hypothetical protein
MKKAGTNEIQRGQAISFRVPSDTPDHIMKGLQKIKESERRNFSSKIAEFVMEGVGQSQVKDREMVSIPLPRKLTKAQRDWLKYEHSEAMLGSILYHLIADPVRATTLLANLNSNSLDIDEALFLQEEVFPEKHVEAVGEIVTQQEDAIDEVASTLDLSDIEDDLSEFDWESVKKDQTMSEETSEEPDVEDLLGGFLANMNK